MAVVVVANRLRRDGKSVYTQLSGNVKKQIRRAKGRVKIPNKDKEYDFICKSIYEVVDECSINIIRLDEIDYNFLPKNPNGEQEIKVLGKTITCDIDPSFKIFTFKQAQ